MSDTVLSHVVRVRHAYPLAEAELRKNGADAQADEWVILSERGMNAVVIGNGKSMPDAWADADTKLWGKQP